MPVAFEWQSLEVVCQFHSVKPEKAPLFLSLDERFVINGFGNIRQIFVKEPGKHPVRWWPFYKDIGDTRRPASILREARLQPTSSMITDTYPPTSA